MKNFYLISTNHLKSGMLFDDEDDYRAGMNIVPICAFLTNVKVLSFILMSSHVHFVLECTRTESKLFIDKFKMLYSKYYCRRHGVREFLRRLGTDIQEVYIEDESLFRAIAYVIMNCVAANLVPNPVLYPWGTGSLVFSAMPSKGIQLGDMSLSRRRKFLKSKVELPRDYIVGDYGYIRPHSYVPVKFVESLFRTPKRYSYFLNNSSKAKHRLNNVEAPSFHDTIVKAGMKSLIQSLFRMESLEGLEERQKVELIRQIQWRFGSDENQLVRISGLPPVEVNKYINGFY